MNKLISFIMPSRRLDNVAEFLDNIHKTVADPQCVEVLIKFDDDQPGVVEFIESEKQKRPFAIHYIVTPRLEGIYSVWVAMEQLFYKTDPSSYFIQILSDEPRFVTPHWDKVLRQYIAFFPDDMFRLRLSSMKFANYATHYECTFRPDSFPIYTRRWLELTEGTGNCWGSDAFQQCVAFHLALGPGSYFNFYRENGSLCRDVVVNNITLDGLEFGIGVTREEQRERHKRNLKEWARLTSFTMQEHFSYLARRMNCYVYAYENGLEQVKFLKCEKRKTVALINAEGETCLELSYAVPRSIVYAQNFLRFVVTLPRRIMVFLLGCIKKPTSHVVNAFHKHEAGASSPSKADITSAAIKKQVKIFINSTWINLCIPYNVLMSYVDRWVAEMPPGISVLSKKPNVPKRLKMPSQEQIRWLQAELKHQTHCRQNLTDKTFSRQKDLVSRLDQQKEVAPALNCGNQNTNANLSALRNEVRINDE